MDASRIRQLKMAKPFRKFYMLLYDGSRMLVDAAHHVAIAPDGSRIGVALKDGVFSLRPSDIRDVDLTAPAFKTSS